MIYVDGSLYKAEVRFIRAQSYWESFIILQNIVIYNCNSVALFSSRGGSSIEC